MFDSRRAQDVLPPMYDPSFEHDACGIGVCVDIKGRRSRKNVEDALKIVENLEHRAGKDAEGKTGDGVGILTQVPHEFMKKAAAECGITLGEEREYGVGMFFFPQDELRCNRARKMFEVVVSKEGLKFLGWRKVATNPEVLGEKALSCMPSIWQGFVEKPEHCDKGLEFDRRLYIARRVFEQSSDNTYVLSLSSRTIVYKGMFLVGQLRTFYPDLQDADYTSAIALVHSRFSTNTFPSWERAHPNRFIVHNGEINTIRGNADNMFAREENMDVDTLHTDMTRVMPVVNAEGSDSAMLDNTLEFLTMSGMELPKAVMVTIPEPWENDDNMSRRKRDFYQYYATMMEPWDGPASIIFSDGDVVGAVLDRNGLRPSRYMITADDRLILSSEAGILPIPASKIVRKDRLRPGKMLLVDLKKGRLIDDEQIKERYAKDQPYGEWLDNNLLYLKDLRIPNARIQRYQGGELKRMQKAFGYSYESVMEGILPMATNGVEKTASMGVDTALPMLNPDAHPLFHFFKQHFAQVTNPPIDTLREKVVTSTSVYVGQSGNLLEEEASNCRVLKIHNPILTNTDLLKIKYIKTEGFKAQVLPITYYAGSSLEKALQHLFVETDRAFRDGVNVLILSDRGVDENHVAIPSLLAVSAVNHHLINMKKRTSVSLILESAEPCEVHDFATLLGYGASAINPYLAQETIRNLIEDGLLEKDEYAAINDYNKAVVDGIIKIAGKMGISTIQSYQGSQIFEAIGIDSDVIEKYFTNTVCRVGGLSLRDIEESAERRHNRAFDLLGLPSDLSVDSIGDHSMRSGGEEHLYNPATIHLLQQATRRGDYKLFKEYSRQLTEELGPMTLRSLLDFKFADEPISLDEVESVESIVKRFKTGAMSYGSLSGEAHETLAIAMNAIGGKSNTGEGGEAEDRMIIREGQPNRCSAVKQVASGRFGVTSRYLTSAKEIQIKMAQGAKPGEGGHLPGGKVYPWVAQTRHSTPGVSLISPPPHHDIYSIEDLAELIYDLKNANRHAGINVKLVSEAGVGTIAAGVAKAGAEVILISGYDGGTGAAPKNSIHNAGLPWELGLAETHQTLLLNGLREKVRIETDGKLMTGRDICIAALLGAEEFGFATAPLIVLGCVMMRVCSLDTCPMGVATQNPELRKRFAGKPEHVINLMHFLAQELREYMAKLGIRSMDELVGRTDLLKMKEDLPVDMHPIDLSAILNNPYAGADSNPVIFKKDAVYDFELKKTPDMKVLLKKMKKSLENGEKAELSLKVKNTDRAFGTIFGSEITRALGNDAADDQFTIRCQGAGGQSFGAFIPKGLSLYLTGESNDYFGKGLSGGKLVLTPPEKAAFVPEENIIVGNVALYGATSGKAFINGVAGERFCVRNSGAVAVVEGVGDHGCEYMTGGRVVILGNVGKNFAAGMSGGIAYVLDEENELYLKLNKAMVSSGDVTNKYDVAELKSMLEEHVRETGSQKAAAILADFKAYLPKFRKIIPHDYARMLKYIGQMEEKGLSMEQAYIEAFYKMQKEG
ncbi:MAG: glutamate synthase large subunit [Lachnospiraceae bacterium]|nr:glutamate synthase large subunit [Candidatus Equihabitans merdae]